MDEDDRHAAFSDSRRDPLDQAQSHISAGKNTRYARFKQIGVAIRWPSLGLHNFVSGQHVPAPVSRYVGWQPSGFRVGSNKDEGHRIRGGSRGRWPIDNIDCRQMCVAMGRLHFRLQFDRNICFVAYLVSR